MKENKPREIETVLLVQDVRIGGTFNRKSYTTSEPQWHGRLKILLVEDFVLFDLDNVTTYTPLANVRSFRLK
jgi:hypothetical protein